MKKIKNLTNKQLKEAEEIISELNEKQKAFCREYIFDWNGTRAYQKVYNCEYDTAKNNSCRLLTNAYIKLYINEIKNNIEENCGISKTKVVAEHVKIAFSSASQLHDTWMTRKKFEDLKKNNPDLLDCIQEIETKKELVNLGGKIKNQRIEEVEMIKIKFYNKQTSLSEISKLIGYDEPIKYDLPVNFNISLNLDRSLDNEK